MKVSNYKHKQKMQIYNNQCLKDNFSYRNRNFDNLPKVSGMGPLKLFKYRSKLTKLVRFPRSIGIGPLILLLYNSLLSERMNGKGVSSNKKET